MNKQDLQTKISNLKAEDQILRSRLETVREKYDRPTHLTAKFNPQTWARQETA